jgi:hypothetical protein
MITENILSIWSGKYESQKELDSYIEEIYDEEGELNSKFMEDFKITYIDNQFQEAVFLNKKITLDMLNDASYSASFLNKLSEIDFREDNSILILYDFNYNKAKKIKGKLRFIGSFKYQKD